MAALKLEALRKLAVDMRPKSFLEPLDRFINFELRKWMERVIGATNDHAERIDNVRTVVDYGHFTCRPLAASSSFQKMYVWWWTDEKRTALSGTKPATSNVVFEEYGNSGMWKTFFRRDRDSYVFFEYQMPHEWCGTPVRLHGHFIGCSSTAGTVVMKGVFNVGGNGDVTPFATAWDTWEKEIEFAGAADLYEKRYISLVELDPKEDPGFSDMFSVSIYRAGLSDPDDDYDGSKDTTWGGTAQANLCVEQFDLHIQRFIANSEEEFSGNMSTNPSVVVFDPDGYSGDIYLECVVQCDSGNSVSFDLYDENAGASVAGSGLSTTSTSPVVIRTGPLTLVSGPRKYWVRGKYDSEADEPKLFKARFVIGPPEASA